MLTYSVWVSSDRSVSTFCFDEVDRFNPQLKINYNSVEEMPMWAQEKLAVLAITTPPTDDIKPIGRRLTDDKFWIFKEEDRDGINAGESS
jgi:hypothetical protein